MQLGNQKSLLNWPDYMNKNMETMMKYKPVFEQKVFVSLVRNSCLLSIVACIGV